MFAATRHVATAGNKAVKGSAYFNGSAHLEIASNAALNPESGAFTLEMWVKPTNWTPTYSLLFASAGSGGLMVGKVAANFAVRRYAIADLLQTTTFPTAGAWNHVAVANDGSPGYTLSLFINGTRATSGSWPSGFTTNPTSIGWDGGGTETLFTGSLSNIRLVKGVTVYDPTQTTLSVPTSPLTAISGTTLLACTSPSVITDTSTNGFSITNTGVTASSDSPF